jgi:hypothetical protein
MASSRAAPVTLAGGVLLGSASPAVVLVVHRAFSRLVPARGEPALVGDRAGDRRPGSLGQFLFARSARRSSSEYGAVTALVLLSGSWRSCRC